MPETTFYPRTLTHEVPKSLEEPLARRIEDAAAKLSPDAFLFAAATAVGAAAILQMAGKSSASRFVGQWVAPFLLLGLYNKIVRIAGAERVRVTESSARN